MRKKIAKELKWWAIFKFPNLEKYVKAGGSIALVRSNCLNDKTQKLCPKSFFQCLSRRLTVRREYRCFDPKGRLS